MNLLIIDDNYYLFVSEYAVTLNLSVKKTNKDSVYCLSVFWFLKIQTKCFKKKFKF